jgi:ABC-2 type transport system ATP-binding protein/lipopolysaccharide transport system ATP-binding protein
VRIQALALVEGEDLLDLAIHARDGHPYDYHSRLYAFAVRSRVRDTGVARLAHTWHVGSAGGEEP